MAWRKKFTKIFTYRRGGRLSNHVQTVSTSLTPNWLRFRKVKQVFIRLTRTLLRTWTSLKLFFKCCRTSYVTLGSSTFFQTVIQRSFLFIVTKLVIFVRSLIFARFSNFIEQIAVKRFARTSG